MTLIEIRVRLITCMSGHICPYLTGKERDFILVSSVIFRLVSKLKLTINANQIKCWFLRTGENRRTRRKPLGADIVNRGEWL